MISFKPRQLMVLPIFRLLATEAKMEDVSYLSQISKNLRFNTSLDDIV